MGRRNKKTKKKGGTGAKTRKAKIDSAETKYTVDQLMDKAKEFIDTFEYELAQKFCQRALEMEPDCVRVLETTASLLLELGDTEAAKNCFGRAIEVEPDLGHAKYMYMGQLLTGTDAIGCFNKGIELLKKAIAESQDGVSPVRGDSSYQSDGTVPHGRLVSGSERCSGRTGQSVEHPDGQENLVRKGASDSWTDRTNAELLSSGYCSLAEIYLTDECFDDEADEKCERCLQQALETDPSNCEAYHLMASYSLSKDDKQKAREMIDKGISLWLPQLQEASKPEGATVDPVQVCPVSYPARINVCKILIELESYEKASEVLELLLDEDDEIVEVWYLLGWSNYLQGDDYKGNARDYLQKAQQVNAKVGSDDEELVKHIDELMQELGPETEAENDEVTAEMEIESDTESEADSEEKHTDKKTDNVDMEH